MDNVAIVLLAGGYASRFPHKLEHPIAGRPMFVHCYERIRQAGWPVYVAARASFREELGARIDAPVIVDRNPGAGPLLAFVDACETIEAERIFAVAADQPELEGALLQRVAAAWRNGDEAAVPQHDGAIEPLAALYDRCATLREAVALRTDRKSAMRDLVGRLNARFVACDAQYFRNVNRPQDLLDP
jgi:molybdopterin-guanine dinucleotide biosynthesis protein A